MKKDKDFAYQVLVGDADDVAIRLDAGTQRILKQEVKLEEAEALCLLQSRACRLFSGLALIVFTSTVTSRTKRRTFTWIVTEVSAKFRLDPVPLAANFGFRAHELREIQLIVSEPRAPLLEAWNEFFGSSGR